MRKDSLSKTGKGLLGVVRCNSRPSFITNASSSSCSAGEFPSLSWLAPSQVGALTGVRKLVLDVLRDMHRTGEAAPTPLSERTYGGQFKLRIPPFLHRQLVLEAQENLRLAQPPHQRKLASG